MSFGETCADFNRREFNEIYDITYSYAYFLNNFELSFLAGANNWTILLSKKYIYRFQLLSNAIVFKTCFVSTDYQE